MRLSQQWIREHDVSLNIEELPERILQIGEGNFLRGFVDWLIHQLIKNKQYDGRVVVSTPRPMGAKKIQAINEQDGLYTVWLRGLQNGEVVDSREIVQSISRGIDPYTQWDEFLQCARNPQIDIVISNTTEAGLAYSPEPDQRDICPTSYPARLTAYLYERYQAFAGAKTSGLDIVPCELVENNGDLLRDLVLQCASYWKLSLEFKNWVKKYNYFYNTLVDSIVTGFTTNGLVAGDHDMEYEDRLGIIREPFYLWVIQGEARLQQKLDFASLGLNVRFEKEVAPFRLIKVRILNGVHTALAGLSFLAHLETVKMAVTDDMMGKFVRELLNKEIIPALAIRSVPESEAQRFAQAVLERFSNPLLRHEIVALQLNGLSKIRVRLLPTMMDFIRATGKLPSLLIMAIAGQLLYYKNADDLSNHWNIRDDENQVRAVQAAWLLESTQSLHASLTQILSLDEVWGQDLSVIPQLVDLLEQAVIALRTGVFSALSNWMGQ